MLQKDGGKVELKPGIRTSLPEHGKCILKQIILASWKQSIKFRLPGDV